MDYTVIGDGVNLASRLESANKYYKTNILISEMTFSEPKDTYIFREIDSMQVQGKSRPVGVYEIYLERCQYFLQAPPEDTWDGAWVMESN